MRPQAPAVRHRAETAPKPRTRAAPIFARAGPEYGRTARRGGSAILRTSCPIAPLAPGGRTYRTLPIPFAYPENGGECTTSHRKTDTSHAHETHRRAVRRPSVDRLRVEYHPYDTRIEGRRGINSANIARIEAACAERTTIRLALISDTQRHYDETAAAVRALNARDDVDFVIHAGDMTDFGMRAEFERQRDLLERLRVP